MKCQCLIILLDIFGYTLKTKYRNFSLLVFWKPPKTHFIFFDLTFVVEFHQWRKGHSKTKTSSLMINCGYISELITAGSWSPILKTIQDWKKPTLSNCFYSSFFVSQFVGELNLWVVMLQRQRIQRVKIFYLCRRFYPIFVPKEQLPLAHLLQLHELPSYPSTFGLSQR